MKQGETDGFERDYARLYSAYRANMTAYASAILAGDFAAGEDAVEEAFTDIWRRKTDIASIDSEAAWIRRIVRNKAVDILRKASVRGTEIGDDNLAGIASDAPSPEQHAAMNDDSQWLQASLAALNVDQREAIVLCYFEGQSLAEIADATGACENTVKTRLFHARRKMGQWLDEHSVAPGGQMDTPIASTARAAAL